MAAGYALAMATGGGEGVASGTGGGPAPSGAPAPVRGHGFGTAPVFLAAISTILGAILFLRFGYAVAHAGAWGTVMIVLIGHLVTLPTALAISEIATNRRVEGGGEYFIVSRSFGTTIGGTIGISLYLSQAVSVAFYMIAFAEAFRPMAPYLETAVSFFGVEASFDPRWVSVPGVLLLVLLVTLRGAAMGVGVLWIVSAVLAVSLGSFFLGAPLGPGEGRDLLPVDSAGAPVPFRADPFMLVFAIVFPAFTGMTAGVGLSGDLAEPRRSIPLGTLTATIFGMAVYLAVVWKLSASATTEQLAHDPLVMGKIAIWGPLIPIGLACASASSAIGSILVAPRTLQALASDRVVPARRANYLLSRGHGEANDPRNATLLTGLVALATVMLGNVDFVARIISMFFMVTYGSLCAISFLEHFAARPSYRPSFRSTWYLSLLGAVMCLALMFQMDPLYALLAVAVMAGLYVGIRSSREEEEDDLGAMFHGVMTQATRWMQVKLQKSLRGRRPGDWRPSLIMVNRRTFERTAHLQLLTWLCHRYGFATYLHLIEGRLTAETFRESRAVLPRLIEVARARRSAIYVDTIVSPTLTSALAQSVQVPGVSGMENNTVMLEFTTHDGEEVLKEVEEGCRHAAVSEMNTLVLRASDHFFGQRRRIHVWLTWHDYQNADLMILLAYILLGHPDWKEGEISVFAAFPQGEVAARTDELKAHIEAGRISITSKNVRIFATDAGTDFPGLVERTSGAADLVIFGFTRERLEKKGVELFRRCPGLRDVLFVSALQRVEIE